MQIELASPTGLVRTILLVLALFFAARILGRLLTPLFRGSGTPTAPGAQRPEGDVKIEFTGKDDKKQKPSGSKEGEYIDYKEVD